MSKPKRVNLERIDPEGRDGEIYDMMESLIANYRPQLVDAKIILFWQFGWKEDADSMLTLGKACKASDLSKELCEHDFVIQLNHDFWSQASNDQRRALLHHELCHCEPAMDKEDNQKMDEHGRLQWRLRKHDIGEFKEVVHHHRLWSPDLQSFAQVIRERERQPLVSPQPFAGDA